MIRSACARSFSTHQARSSKADEFLNHRLERESLPALSRSQQPLLHRLGLEQICIIDAQLAEGLADVKAGRTFGPFDNADEMIAHMKAQLKKVGTAPRAKRSQ